MILPPEDAALFYRAWWPLLAWVNNQRHIVPSFPIPTPDRPLPVPIANPVRLALWADDSLRERFLAEGAGALGAAERELIASWKHRISGQFIVFKHLRTHSIFMSKDVFGVTGIYSPLAELVRTVPAYVDAVLLPFGGRIIIDGILTSPGVQLSFGAGMRRVFETQYAEARDRSQIRTSLLAPAATKADRKPSRSPVRRVRPKVKVGPSSVIGTWRITKSELWDRDALDLVEHAFIRFERDQRGELALIAVRADVDYRLDKRDGKPRLEFSFLGDDEGDLCSGRGWAALDDDEVLRGRLYIHGSDDSSFEAERVNRPTVRKTSRRGGGG
jgi:hypothetical protein